MKKAPACAGAFLSEDRAWLPGAAGTIRLGLRLVHLQGATVHLVTVQVLDGAGGVRIGHLDEAEAARLPGVTIRDQGDGLDRAVGGEKGAHGGFIGREREVTNVNLAH